MLGGRLVALGYRDFRLLFFGQAVSAVGSWMQLVAQGWLVYDLTGSSFYLGLVALARAIPVLVFALIGGAVADRYDRRAIMTLANGSVGLLALVLTALTLTGAVAVWHVIAIAFLMGIAFSFEMPSRQSLVSTLVEPKHVVNAVGLNSLAFNLAAMVGPALAGLLIEPLGVGGLFLLNGLSYVAVVAAALLMRPTRRVTPAPGGILENVVSGLRYVGRTPELLALISMMSLISLLARPYIHMLPIFAGDILHVGAAGLGALNALSGAGSVAAAVLVAGFGSFKRRGLVLTLCGALFGVAGIIFSLSTSYGLSLAAVLALGFCSAYTGIVTNTMLQSHSDPRMRGRVMSLHGLTMMGVVPLGTMLEGALGSVIGVPLVVLIGGALTVVAAAATLLLAPRLRTLE